MDDEGTARAEWRAANERAAATARPLVEKLLTEAARRRWGRRWFGRRWRIVARPSEAAWRAYRWVEGFTYEEIGVVCHIDPDGRIVGIGIDNGVDFLALKDVSEYGLRRGLEHLRLQERRTVKYTEPPAGIGGG